ncbi:MAG: hypothetical protein IPJ65_03510 [Archangiaceae bacterium]|nr:hypothetical protein [Archangiaceae bacterium]
MVFALHSVVPHKEIRFILTVLPLFGVRGRGLTHPPSRLAGRCSAALDSTALHPEPHLGRPGRLPSAASGARTTSVRSIGCCSPRAEAEGGGCSSRARTWPAGGSTYLHQRALPSWWHAPAAGRAVNYVITPREGGEVVARDGNLKLVRLGVEACVADLWYRRGGSRRVTVSSAKSSAARFPPKIVHQDDQCIAFSTSAAGAHPRAVRAALAPRPRSTRPRSKRKSCLGHLMVTAPKVRATTASVDRLPAGRQLQNRDAGQTVFHLHLHPWRRPMGNSADGPASTRSTPPTTGAQPCIGAF